MKYILETERLLLREFNLNDTKFIIELLNSEGWIKYIGERNIKNDDDAKTYLQQGPLKSYEVNGYGLWLVVVKDTMNPIGMCGIINRSTLENPDIGFAFLPEYMHKGYAYEIAKATLTYAIAELKIPILHAITVSFNTNSINLLNKIGLKYINTINLPDDPEELMLFST